MYCETLVVKNPSLKNQIILLFYTVMGYAAFRSWIKEKFLTEIKKTFFSDFIQNLWPDAKYLPSDGISQQEFEASTIFPYEINDYASTNRIHTRKKIPPIQLAHVTAAYHAYGAKNSTKIFQGLFLVTDFNKNTSGRTYALPDRAERLLGRPGQELQSLSKSHGELVKTEDPEFEKYFAVYSTDQVEARYILSPSFMRNLMEFRRKVNNDVFVSFIDGKMYLGISNGLLMNDVDLFKPVSSESLASPFSTLTAIHKLLEISLKNRIWTKE